MSILGMRFGNLIVLSEHRPPGTRYPRVMIRCDCGVEKETCGRSVRRGRTRSCGCLQINRATTHALSKHPEYRRLQGMILRCHNVGAVNYSDYGGRGITVCDEWRQNPGAFIEWAAMNGGSPETEIDRIENSAGYSPKNCRFVSCKENRRNRTDNVLITVSGKKMTLAEASETFSVSYDTLRQRIVKLGWDAERAVSQPVRKMVAA